MRRDVLLLQGPIGPFFNRFANELEDRDFVVHKVNLNGGDKCFYRRAGAVDYTGEIEHWGAFLERFIINNKIGRLYLFGDCRSYHRIAKKIAIAQNVRVFVFEEGYIRPNFITLEENGVNGHSSMLRKDFVIPKRNIKALDESDSPKHIFVLTAIYSMIYYWASALASRRFPHYQHHRAFRWLPEGWRWVVSGMRKLRYERREKEVLNQLLPEFANNYFVCPLQVHCDMQVVVHSDYNSIEHFIGDVLTSFSKFAPKNKALVFKHHPLDRGYTDYTSLLDNLISELGLQGRVYYVHDVCLPTLLRNAQGTVLINSTVGMSSLFHGTPVKTLGKAIYDLPGITSDASLKRFWKSRETVDTKAFINFRQYLISRNQINGNLYRTVSSDSAAGLIWSEALNAEHRYMPDRLEIQEGPVTLRVVAGLDVDPPTQQDKSDDAEAA